MGVNRRDAALKASRPAALWVRGDADRVIPGAGVQRTEDYLRVHTTPRISVIPGLDHGISTEVLAEVRAFLVETVGPGVATQ